MKFIIYPLTKFSTSLTTCMKCVNHLKMFGFPHLCSNNTIVMQHLPLALRIEPRDVVVVSLISYGIWVIVELLPMEDHPLLKLTANVLRSVRMMALAPNWDLSSYSHHASLKTHTSFKSQDMKISWLHVGALFGLTHLSSNRLGQNQ